ncbi:hypothetical protein IAT40_002791 [Kwoniella sp. CBS 6097]
MDPTKHGHNRRAMHEPHTIQPVTTDARHTLGATSEGFQQTATFSTPSAADHGNTLEQPFPERFFRQQGSVRGTPGIPSVGTDGSEFGCDDSLNHTSTGLYMRSSQPYNANLLVPDSSQAPANPLSGEQARLQCNNLLYSQGGSSLQSSNGNNLSGHATNTASQFGTLSFPRSQCPGAETVLGVADPQSSAGGSGHSFSMPMPFHHHTMRPSMVSDKANDSGSRNEHRSSRTRLGSDDKVEDVTQGSATFGGRQFMTSERRREVVKKAVHKHRQGKVQMERELRVQVKSLEKQHANLEKQHAADQTTIESQNTTIESQQTQIESQNTTIKSQQKRIEKQQTQVENQQTQIESQQMTIFKLRHELASLRAERWSQNSPGQTQEWTEYPAECSHDDMPSEDQLFGAG